LALWDLRFQVNLVFLVFLFVFFFWCFFLYNAFLKICCRTQVLVKAWQDPRQFPVGSLVHASHLPPLFRAANSTTGAASGPCVLVACGPNDVIAWDVAGSSMLASFQGLPPSADAVAPLLTGADFTGAAQTVKKWSPAAAFYETAALRGFVESDVLSKVNCRLRVFKFCNQLT
jgi:hypothetical protein